ADPFTAATLAFGAVSAIANVYRAVSSGRRSTTPASLATTKSALQSRVERDIADLYMSMGRLKALIARFGSALESKRLTRDQWDRYINSILQLANSIIECRSIIVNVARETGVLVSADSRRLLSNVESYMLSSQQLLSYMNQVKGGRAHPTED